MSDDDQSNNNKVTRLPINNNKQRMINQYGDGFVPCVVSERWLQFPEKSYIFQEGVFMEVSVMTKKENGEPYKIYNLVITREDLLRTLNSVTSYNG